jgi:hypothetical protein
MDGWSGGTIADCSMKCIVVIVCDVCCTSENPLPVGEGVWSMFNTVKMQIWCMAFNSGRTGVDR